MKILLTLFVLLFSSSVVADDISDFQIDGIGLGDSLLDKFTEEEILKDQRDYYQGTQFLTSLFLTKDQTLEYEQISINYKRNDKKFIVHSVNGAIYYTKDKDIENCYAKRDEIIKNLSETLKVSEWKHSRFDDNEGSFDNKFFDLESGTIKISCYDWNKETEIKLKYVDYLGVEILSKELEEMLNNYSY